MKKSTELVRWMAPSTVVADRLVQKKDALTRAEKMWVYNDLVWLAALSPFWLISALWVSFPLTMQTQAWIFFGIFTAAVAACLVALVARQTSKYHNPIDHTETRVLSREGRIKWVKYDNNRKRMPHAKFREKRPPEADQRYDQFSVWVYPEGMDQNLMLLRHSPRGRFRRYHIGKAAIEHKEMRRRPVKESFVDPHTWRTLQKKAREMGWDVPSEEYEHTETISALKTLRRQKGESSDDFYHRLLEARDHMETMAGEAEEQSFSEAYGTLENRRMSLVVRR